jgi:hypothetical protein
MNFRKLIAFILILGLSLAAQPALAVPILQLYAPGATYDTTTQTWVIVDPEQNGFDLLILTDNTALYSQTRKSVLQELKVLVAYGNEGASVTITPTTAPAPFIDPTLGLTPNLDAEGTIADLMAQYPEASLSLWNHDAVGAAVWGEVYMLGDSAADGSKIGDVTQDFDPAMVPYWTDNGQINAYHVTISGVAEGSYVHFDAFDHVVANKNGNIRYYNAPYSHDVEMMPEPGTLLLLGAGLFGFGISRKKNRASKLGGGKNA